MTDPQQTAAGAAAMLSSESDSMAQIRELLFGAQQRETEQRLAHTDESVLALRRHAAGELERAEQRLHERIERLDTRGVERLAELESAVHDGLQALRQQLEQRIDDLQTLLQAEQAQLARELGEEQDRLQLNKVDRKQLAQLLTQLAEQIGAE